MNTSFMYTTVIMVVVTSVMTASLELRGEPRTQRADCEPTVGRQHVQCARRGAHCYSGPFFSDSCAAALACRVETVGLGASVWDDGVYGTCVKKPRRSMPCERCRKPSKRPCFLPAMTEHAISQLTVNSARRYYVTCACFRKCFPTPKLSPQVRLSPSFQPYPTPCKC